MHEIFRYLTGILSIELHYCNMEYALDDRRGCDRMYFTIVIVLFHNYVFSN